MIEIERKFLVKSAAFMKEAVKHNRIVQGYLSSAPERTVRVRIKGGNGYSDPACRTAVPLSRYRSRGRRSSNGEWHAGGTCAYYGRRNQAVPCHEHLDLGDNDVDYRRT